MAKLPRTRKRRKGFVGKVYVRTVCYPLGDLERLREPAAANEMGLARCPDCSYCGVFWVRKSGKAVRGWRHKKGCPRAVSKKADKGV